jgi:hypothetical protein
MENIRANKTCQAARQLPDGRRCFIVFFLLAGLLCYGREFASLAASSAAALFAKKNLVAWCIVPFDAKKRGPEERALMLDRLGLRRLAYDWRDEHIPTFDEEVKAMKRHHIEIIAWWFPAELNPTARRILEVLERHQLKCQLWVTMDDPAPQTTLSADKVKAAAAQLRPIAIAAAKLGCKMALYNHGGWFGDPLNQIAILHELKMSNVGIVYNFHHGHDDIDRFPQLFKQIQPYLMAINLNGMVKNGEQLGKKIVTLGQGDEELQMMRVIANSGWHGPVGILDHRPETDSEITLRENLEGLEQLKGRL